MLGKPMRIPTLVLFFKNLLLLDSEGQMRPTVYICLFTHTAEPCLNRWLEHRWLKSSPPKHNKPVQFKSNSAKI